jgi:hypothetical protein
MANFNKADWQKAAKALKIKFQNDDSITSLVERIALKLKVSNPTKTNVQKAYEAHASKPKAAPAKKKAAGKKKSAPKKEAAAPEGMNRKFAVKRIIFDRPLRKDICVEIEGKEIWLPKDKIEMSKDGKTVTMPDWLAGLKDV